jgi:hypothetical protein
VHTQRNASSFENAAKKKKLIGYLSERPIYHFHTEKEIKLIEKEFKLLEKKSKII